MELIKINRITTFIFLILFSTNPLSSLISYDSREIFIKSTGSNITDDYSTYLYDGSVRSDLEMSAVFGETVYTSLTFPNLHLAGASFRDNDSVYCAGCNGNFKLSFETTSLSGGGGIFGIGIDFVLHTSRRVSIGDDDPSNPTFEGGILVEFIDGTSEQLYVPTDIGYYDDEIYFLGLTDIKGIKSLTVGTEPTSSRHSWAIDNLTIATSVSEPAFPALLVTALIGLGLTRRKRLAS